MSETKEILETTEEAPRTVVFEEALEAILFAAGHPITYATIARVLEMTPALVKDKVFEYAIKYNDPSIPRGVILLTYKDSCQLCTKEYYLNEIRDALGIRKSGSLSTSSMEVLAIVAYNQPVTRAFVDTLRRVDSSYAMNNLLDRGLITSTGRLDVPGRPMLYGTTSDFLRCFGLSDLDSLPKTSDELIEVFEGAKANEERELEEADQFANAEQLSLDIDSAVSSDDNNESGKNTEAENAEEKGDRI
jgi:segregation and condensation protein B